MVALTYGDARVSGVDTAPKAATRTAIAAAPRKPWLSRLFDAMIEARMQQARREIKMYTGLMPYTVDAQGNRKLKTETHDMPFGGW
jgi:hypothetical protein